MSPEERSLLERTYKLAVENNEALKAIRRTTRFGTVMRVTYWVILIGLSVGAFYFLQPYVDFIRGFGGDQNGSSQNSTSSQDYLDTLNDLLR